MSLVPCLTYSDGKFVCGEREGLHCGRMGEKDGKTLLLFQVPVLGVVAEGSRAEAGSYICSTFLFPPNFESPYLFSSRGSL